MPERADVLDEPALGRSYPRDATLEARELEGPVELCWIAAGRAVLEAVVGRAVLEAVVGRAVLVVFERAELTFVERSTLMLTLLFLGAYTFDGGR